MQLNRPDFTADVDILFTFSYEDAEMYLGHTPISVDTMTALYMLRQKESMPQADGWNEHFPGVVNHTTSRTARQHPDFIAAKKGDFDAALRLVDALVKDDKILEIARRFPDAHVAYIHKQQGDSINMIPAAFAMKFAALGMTVEHDIVAVTNVAHTDASDIARISRRVRFDGKVTQGASYILLDDFITTGAELRDLRDYISSKGGNVVAMTTLGHGSFGRLSDIRIDNIYRQKFKEDGITDQDLRKYGIASGIDCLTISEAAIISRVVNKRANREAAQERLRLQDVCGAQPTVSAVAKEVPRAEEPMRTGFHR